MFAAVLQNFNLPSVRLPELGDYLAGCIHEFSRGNRVELARQDAEGFELPLQAYTKDMEDLAQAGSLVELIRSRQEAAAPSRYNLTRCNDVFGEFPSQDLERARTLAISGSLLLEPENFIRQHSPQELRPLAHSLGNTYLKHAHKLWKNGSVLLFSLSGLDQATRDVLHFGNNVFWTVKPDDVMGRLLTDPNHPQEGCSGLNTDEAFVRAQEIYGAMTLPTIKEFVTDILEYADKNNYPLSELRLYKEDIKNAFGQSMINPLCARLSAMRMDEDLAMIYMYGFFGYHAQPLVFAVFSRLLKRKLTITLAGPLCIYVDDLMGCVSLLPS